MKHVSSMKDIIKEAKEQAAINTPSNSVLPGLWSNEMDDMAIELIEAYKLKTGDRY